MPTTDNYYSNRGQGSRHEGWASGVRIPREGQERSSTLETEVYYINQHFLSIDYLVYSFTRKNKLF